MSAQTASKTNRRPTSRNRPKLSRNEIQTQALSNALSRETVTNYEAIFDGFAEKGIPMAAVEPRKNVFTYNAWQALGRQVRKGEKGVKIVTFIEAAGKEANGTEGETEGFKFSRTVSVFHVSQTDPIERPSVESAPL